MRSLHKEARCDHTPFWQAPGSRFARMVGLPAMGVVLYLHGFGSSSESVKGQYLASRLRQAGHEVLLPDLDAGDFAGTTLSKQLRLVANLVRERRPDLVIGSSLGAYLGALHAARHPETVPALVLLAPAFNFAEQLAEQLGDMARVWRRDGPMAFRHYRTQGYAYLPYEFLEDAAEFEAFPDVAVPTKVLHPIRDALFSAHLTEIFATEHGNVQVEWLDADHGMTEVQEEIWSSIEALLRSTA